MQDNGPLIALIFFIIGTGVFGTMAYQRQEELMGAGNPDQALDVLIEEERDQLEAVLKGIREKEDLIEVLHKDIELQHVIYELNDNHEGVYRRHYERRNGLVTSGRSFSTAADEVGVKVVEAKENTQKNIRQSDAETQRKTEEEVQGFKEKKEAAEARKIAVKKDYEEFETKIRSDRNYVNSRLGEFKRQLDLLTKRDRERAHIEIEEDGKVVFADTTKNTVVINIGTSQGIRNGWRFEVYAMRAGHKKVSKGYLEVRNATSTMSECMIMRKLVKLPKDPLSDYTASEPEEKYSPYQETGRAGFSAQVLSAVPKTTVMGMNMMDPIVEGDLIQNPFYGKGRELTFYIAGDKTIEKGVQVSSIAYTWPHIEQVLRYYGAKSAKAVDLGVDYIIAQKNPQDDEEFLKAENLGIPVVYEWELFRFLDQR